MIAFNTLFVFSALATSSDPLSWSWAELPCDSQTVALLACVVENPQDFYCHISNPKGIVVFSSEGYTLVQLTIISVDSKHQVLSI